MSKDHPPLLSPGLHPMTMREVYQVCVEPFNSPEHREYLYGRLESFFAHLTQLGLDYRAWLDGSFLSEKPEPADIDLVIICREAHINSLSPGVQDALVDIFSRYRKDTKLRYGCDVYLMIAGDSQREQYWRDLFGSDRSGSSKGIIEV